MNTSEVCCHLDPIPQRKAAKRVLGLIQRHGLTPLSAYEVFLLLSQHAEGARFAASFRKRKVCYFKKYMDMDCALVFVSNTVMRG